ncbi:hypothetical protein [Acidianus sp. HS-5]|uniref:hypothetical protein n=1 Tax=Acidianus sp. HS-5 TaxID=2886040 RepID=UPI001F3D4824|nr:hypothetical protein [Acidianus sp. HS-5]BDC18677.1 hypothetical protein HS5_15670 [Acidianus sp. HS-5]
MAGKFLFITKDKKFLYDGKVREIKKELQDLDGVEIRFARPMIVYDLENVNLRYFVKNYGQLVVGDYTVLDLVDLLEENNFILFVDHKKKVIEVLVQDKGIITLPYSTLDFLRYLLAKTSRGVLLENATFDIIAEDQSSHIEPKHKLRFKIF